MSLRRTKDIDSLYAEVADYDLVLVPDGPFASALNRRLDRPHFGHFAISPRRLAAGRRERAEDREAFLKIIERTDHDWRAIAYEIGNILQCWEHQGHLDAILDYEAYVTETTEAVVKLMRSMETTSNRLTAYEVDAGQSVAVVGDEQLTQLERNILPSEYDRVDLFADGSFETPAFHIFQSATDIISALVDAITVENAERVGVVLDQGSQYAPLVESAFESAGIPFYGGPGFIDDPHHRTFIRLLRLAFRGSDVTVGDAQPILTRLGRNVSIEDREKRLTTAESPGVAWIQEFRAELETRTFAAALREYTEQTAIGLPHLADELKNLGLSNDPVTSENVDRLAYYLQTYEVPTNRENEGVILADATSSEFVDRPTVFYLGMGQGWTHSSPQRPWVESDREFERNIAKFQRLLQSGQNQYYLVQDTAGGEPVIPCLYFNDLLDEEFDRFSDLDADEHYRRIRSTGPGFDRQPVGIDPTPIETISQSSLNSYVNSPRDYFFRRLLDIPDKEYFVRGTLFHDFAEFFVDHPEVIEGTDLDELVDLTINELEPFFPPEKEPLRRREIRIGLEMISSYLREHRPNSDSFLTPTSSWGTNFFAEYFDKPVESPLTERWFEDSSLGVKGMIDLVKEPDHLVDYKSGSQKRVSTVVKRASIDPPPDTPNYQAALYLTYYRSVQPNEPLAFTFFHFLEPMDKVIAGEPDLDDALTTVRYFPFTFDEYVGSRDAYETLLDGYNDCQETVEDLGYPAYSDIMAQLAFPETKDKDDLRESAFADEFFRAVERGTADAINVEKGADQAIRILNRVRKRSFFREDLDAFEAFIDERLDELNRRRAGAERFPIEGLAGEPNYRRVDNRDLLLEGER